MKRPEKITFGEMRAMGVRGVPIYCADYTCSHSTAVGDADRWPDEVRLSDIERQRVLFRPAYYPQIWTGRTRQP